MSLDQVEEVLYPIAEAATSVTVAHWPSDSRQETIATRAYLLAQQRDFAPGHELDDWLQAEAEFDAWNVGCACQTEGR